MRVDRPDQTRQVKHISCMGRGWAVDTPPRSMGAPRTGLLAASLASRRAQTQSLFPPRIAPGPRPFPCLAPTGYRQTRAHAHTPRLCFPRDNLNPGRRPFQGFGTRKQPVSATTKGARAHKKLCTVSRAVAE
jgi:hypothetical protein